MFAWYKWFGSMLFVYGVLILATPMTLSLIKLLTAKLKKERAYCYFAAFILCAYLLFGPVKAILMDTVYWHLFEWNKNESYDSPQSSSFWFYCKPFYAFNREIVRQRAEIVLKTDYEKLNRPTFRTLRQIMPSRTMLKGSHIPYRATGLVDWLYLLITVFAGLMLSSRFYEYFDKEYVANENILIINEIYHYSDEWRRKELENEEVKYSILGRENEILRKWNRTKNKSYWLECITAWLLGQYSRELRELFKINEVESLKRLSLLKGGRYDTLFKR